MNILLFPDHLAEMRMNLAQNVLVLDYLFYPKLIRNIPVPPHIPDFDNGSNPCLEPTTWTNKSQLQSCIYWTNRPRHSSCFLFRVGINIPTIIRQTERIPKD